MERRDFIKNTCVGCAGLLGAGALLSLFNSCSPLLVLQSDQKAVIQIPANSFVEGKNMLRIKNKTLEFDILLIKKKDSSYTALYMECTHHSQPLTPNKTGLFCASHGSAFDLEGNVTVEPATRPLKKFRTETENTDIKIFIN